MGGWITEEEGSAHLADGAAHLFRDLPFTTHYFVKDFRRPVLRRKDILDDTHVVGGCSDAMRNSTRIVSGEAKFIVLV
ncbi:MAG: hypothetical protein AUI16_17985 [Alphaproteobacteria bacterium 13_2_20CM_2_64_7]|nr:MAG: hypothetical protein AUI16_17985 [Alphaproteobacteria bacterium 13_2_20CM_2_64_7]